MQEVSHIPFKNLIFLDESGVNLEMTPLYGRAFGKDRAVIQTPYRRSHNITMIGAVNYQNVVAAMYGSWSANGEIFLHFLEHELCPKLEPQHVVVMDNVRFHQVVGVKELIESTGANSYIYPLTILNLILLSRCGQN